jgi:hypothetical protein
MGAARQARGTENPGLLLLTGLRRVLQGAGSSLPKNGAFAPVAPGTGAWQTQNIPRLVIA